MLWVQLWVIGDCAMDVWTRPEFAFRNAIPPLAAMVAIYWLSRCWPFTAIERHSGAAKETEAEAKRLEMIEQAKEWWRDQQRRSEIRWKETKSERMREVEARKAAGRWGPEIKPPP